MRYVKMTRVVLFLTSGVVVVMGVVLFLLRNWNAIEVDRLSSPQDGVLTFSRNIDRLLSQWRPDHEDLSSIIADILQPQVHIEGEWTSNDGPSGETPTNSLSIEANSSGGYTIEFSTRGCLASWHLDREGIYTRGVLRLHRPVQEYGSVTYDTLYAVSVNGTEYLISQAAIRFLMKYHPKDARVDWATDIKSNDYPTVFHRRRGSKRQIGNGEMESKRGRS
jgi:hypothetical protein